MNTDSVIIDDFFVLPSKNKKTLKERLSVLENINDMPTIPKGISKYELYRSIISSNTNNTFFRKSNNSSNILVNYWLEKVRRISTIYSLCGNLPTFEGITKDFVRQVVELSPKVDNLVILSKILEEKGIILVIEPYIPGLKADGAVFINEYSQAVIALSLRFSRLDNFWFTLVHELSHLILHSGELQVPIIDDLEEESSELVEKQANKLAKELLIPRHIWRNCACKYNKSEAVLLEFATQNKIHPAIIAGLLRYELNDYSIYSRIINSIDTREIFFK